MTIWFQQNLNSVTVLNDFQEMMFVVESGTSDKILGVIRITSRITPPLDEWAALAEVCTFLD